MAKNANKGAKSQNVNVQSSKNDLNLSDLEANADNKKDEVNVPQFNNQEWLENNDPKDYHNESEVSSKYDEKREVEIGKGLNTLVELGVELNPLMVLLAKWWEVKTARAEIKKLIDAEAENKGYDKNTYLQTVIGSEVATVAEMLEAISRIKYAKTYFKPRGENKAKVPMKQVRVDGEIYDISIADYKNAKDKFSDDREALIAEIIEKGSKIETIEEF